jgi:hypothetical protein
MSKPKHYTSDDLATASRSKLEIIAECRGVDPEGTGSDGYVTMDDLRDAITADQDRTGVNPALVGAPPTSERVTFVVTGGAPVYGYVAGQSFSANVPGDMTQGQAGALVESGAAALAPDDDEPAPPIPPPAEDPSIDIIEDPAGQEPSDESNTEES